MNKLKQLLEDYRKKEQRKHELATYYNKFVDEVNNLTSIHGREGTIIERINRSLAETRNCPLNRFARERLEALRDIWKDFKPEFDKAHNDYMAAKGVLETEATAGWSTLQSGYIDLFRETLDDLTKILAPYYRSEDRAREAARNTDRIQQIECEMNTYFSSLEGKVAAVLRGLPKPIEKPKETQKTKQIAAEHRADLRRSDGFRDHAQCR